MDISRLQWRKSSRSSGQGGNCVEVASVGGSEASDLEVSTESLRFVRDSKRPDSALLAFSAHEWSAFLSGIKEGRLGAADRA
ncbi:DUF397 domain-containing protein [Sphaerisporangium melleum]|uniref:DUF397 domain-containing protein n=1 Tax=Sphaerisporangium melleum TaxID=321316 RepID=UPI0019526348|nr:DUF397 domain-containing protein [Sphaerisporangium melleum]